MNSITFKTTRLARIFNSEKELHKEYGKRMGDAIKRRMMVFMAAPSLDSVSHFPPERRHELEGSRKGIFAVDLVHPFRLLFVPDHDPLPLKKDGGIDLKRITSITILGVEDYH